MSGDDRGFALGFCIAVLRPLLTVLTKRDWRGTENVPRTGGFVLAANHVSEFDPLAIGHLLALRGRAPRYLAKTDVFEIRLIGPLLRAARQIPVQRRSADAAKAFTAAVDAVRAGRCVVIYPEGTLTKDPNGWPMAGRTGAARVALATGAPVIPVGQWGPQEFLPPKAHRPNLWPRKVMRLQVGPPVDLSDFEGVPLTADVLRAATDRILDAITQNVADLRREPAPAVRFDPSAWSAPVEPSAADADPGETAS